VGMFGSPFLPQPARVRAVAASRAAVMILCMWRASPVGGRSLPDAAAKKKGRVPWRNAALRNP
jgi:hypothetical protein